MTPRRLADSYVAALAELDPAVAVQLGINPGDDRLSDLSPAGAEAVAALGRRTLEQLDAIEAAAENQDESEQRCARLLRERIGAELVVHDAGEDLRGAVNSLSSPLHVLRHTFVQMPNETEEQWGVIARRLGRVPEALDGYRESLELGIQRGLLAAPRQVGALLAQVKAWVEGDWFAALVTAGPDSLRAQLDDAATTATAALAGLRAWMEDVYARAAEGTPDAVGRDRYRIWARLWNGADFDLDEAYGWAWNEFHQLDAEMRAEAEKVLSGATPLEAAEYLKTEGPAVEGAEQAREHLQQLMDKTISDLQGTHFDVAEPITHVQAMIAPVGSAPAPYYTPPTLDFSRPGRTWLPASKEDRYPLWFITSAWYHEGVPGHHLQIAQWLYVAGSLSNYQVSLGAVSSNVEGWALYAERLMDELGYHTSATRLGYLSAQMLRLQRVIVDIGMHLELDFPANSPYRPGERVTPEATREFMGRYSGLDDELLDGEVIRYLGMPGQAIGYKLGERTWLRGREAARAAHGDAFDLKAWHMAALSQGSQGLDDLYETLANL
ncbi:DUF885 domain-containing protein [Actinoplanes sp. TBRC 11911]|uniref:DUF885 domain-containing protein n=1 Tax=Actinoplanes sp. TBRC 11911 TaxID=2729386 RepID=UPI00145C8279|nr:DUF885 domain-containing protein [Actinoplanes sp. TBRC 11911]NMO54798.1 DUF885 domain-containing protein [Actinoplanes sp. TBRC 11911]